MKLYPPVKKVTHMVANTDLFRSFLIENTETLSPKRRVRFKGKISRDDFTVRVTTFHMNQFHPVIKGIFSKNEKEQDTVVLSVELNRSAKWFIYGSLGLIFVVGVFKDIAITFLGMGITSLFFYFFGLILYGIDIKKTEEGMLFIEDGINQVNESVWFNRHTNPSITKNTKEG